MNKPELFPESILIFNDFIEELKQIIIGLVRSDPKAQLNQALDKLIESINATVE